MNVQTFKLVNGEEVVADVSHVGSDFIHADHAVVLSNMKHPESGQIIRGFGDWPALAEPGQSLRIPITAIMVMPVAAHEDLVRHFISAVTGLELPPATPKILLS